MYIHLTDTHIKALNQQEKNQFFSELSDLKPKGVFISGDISTGSHLERHLEEFYDNLKCPIYFVLGNHDYYGKHFGWFKTDHRKLHYLEHSKHPEFIEDFALVGTDGWYDSVWHVPAFPLVYFLDWLFIKDLKKYVTSVDLVRFFRNVSQEKTAVLRGKLEAALIARDQVVVLTHFPPVFIETSSVMRNAFWKPYDVNNSLRDLLIQMGTKYPKKRILVLCGHTHEESVTQLLPNVQVIIGNASVGKMKGIDIMKAKEKFNQVADELDTRLEVVNQPVTPPTLVERATEAVKDAAFDASEAAQGAGKTAVGAVKTAATAVGSVVVAAPGVVVSGVKAVPNVVKSVPEAAGRIPEGAKNLAVAVGTTVGRTAITAKDTVVDGAKGVFGKVKGWFQKEPEVSKEAEPVVGNKEENPTFEDLRDNDKG